MKEIQQMAEDKGYSVVRYDEFDHKTNEDIKKRHMFVFEK